MGPGSPWSTHKGTACRGNSSCKGSEETGCLGGLSIDEKVKMAIGTQARGSCMISPKGNGLDQLESHRFFFLIVILCKYTTLLLFLFFTDCFILSVFHIGI